jgi:hypothetical protein
MLEFPFSSFRIKIARGRLQQALKAGERNAKFEQLSQAFVDLIPTK